MRAALFVLNFCLLPFAVCLLPSLRVRGGGEAYARLGGGLFGVDVFLALALRADAEDAKAVLRRAELVLSDDGVLYGLKFGGVELDGLAALGADHVVVVRVLVVVLVARATVAETNLARESGLDQELERAVDGRVADAWVFLLDEVVEVFARQVLLRSEEHVEDTVALRRALQPGVLYVPVENFLLFSHRPPLPLLPTVPTRFRFAAILTHARRAVSAEF